MAGAGAAERRRRGRAAALTGSLAVPAAPPTQARAPPVAEPCRRWPPGAEKPPPAERRRHPAPAAPAQLPAPRLAAALPGADTAGQGAGARHRWGNWPLLLWGVSRKRGGAGFSPSLAGWGCLFLSRGTATLAAAGAKHKAPQPRGSSAPIRL